MKPEAAGARLDSSWAASGCALISYHCVVGVGTWEGVGCAGIGLGGFKTSSVAFSKVSDSNIERLGCLRTECSRAACKSHAIVRRYGKCTQGWEVWESGAPKLDKTLEHMKRGLRLQGVGNVGGGGGNRPWASWIQDLGSESGPPLQHPAKSPIPGVSGSDSFALYVLEQPAILTHCALEEVCARLLSASFWFIRSATLDLCCKWLMHARDFMH